MNKDKLYDCAIIGGGPAGLSAAIYLARFNRSVVVIDTEYKGRWRTHEKNENYLGFPKGIASKKLRELGKQQAKHFGAICKTDTIIEAHHKRDFKLVGKKATYAAKTIILATGVTDIFPKFAHVNECVGRSLFWCITCDGFKSQDKNIVIVGHDENALTTALQFLNFTKNIVVLTNHNVGDIQLPRAIVADLAKHNIPIYEMTIKKVNSREGNISEIILQNNKKLACDMMFSLQGATPNTSLAKKLGVETAVNGFIIIDAEQRTNVKGVYAAGDVTRSYAHQIVTAAHEGATAAQAANFDLYKPFQK